MRSSWGGRWLLRWYLRLPGRYRLLAMVVRSEGGEFTSLTLRSILRTHHGVEVGPHSYGSLLQPGLADAGLTIGAYVSIGPGVRRFGANHPIDEPLMHPYAYSSSLGFVGPGADVERTRCDIGDDAWIGAGTIILPGCRRIGRGAVVGAGSVVTRDVPDFAVVVGNPARHVRDRLTEQQRADVAGWDLAGTGPAAAVAQAEAWRTEWRKRP